MKNNLKKIGIIIMVLTTLIMISVWISNVVNVNKSYVENEKKDRLVGIGETLELDNISFTVTEAKIYDIESYVSKYSEYPWLESERTYLEVMLNENSDLKILCYNLRVDTGEEYQEAFGVLQSNMCSNSGLWNNSYCYTLMYLMNDEEVFNVGLNDSTEIIVPVCLFEHHFTEEEWAKFDNEDPDIRLEIQQQPELCAIEFDKVERVEATDDEIQYFGELMNMVEEIQNTSNDGLTVLDDNLGEEGVASMGVIQFEVQYIKESSIEALSTADYYYADGSLDYYGGFENSYFCELKYTVTNTSDMTTSYMANMTDVAVMVDEKMVDRFSVIGIMNPPNTGTKQDYTFTLLPGETIDVQVVYNTTFPNEPIELYEMITNAHSRKENFYLMYNPSGQNITSLSNKLALFINLGDFWEE